MCQKRRSINDCRSFPPPKKKRTCGGTTRTELVYEERLYLQDGFASQRRGREGRQTENERNKMLSDVEKGGPTNPLKCHEYMPRNPCFYGLQYILGRKERKKYYVEEEYHCIYHYTSMCVCVCGLVVIYL